jgi:hypothetical protein
MAVAAMRWTCEATPDLLIFFFRSADGSVFTWLASP